MTTINQHACSRASRVTGLCLSLVALIAASEPALAAQQAAEASVGTSEADIVVSARRRAERLQDVPVAASVVNSERLESYAVADLVSITKLIPTMVVTRQTGGSGASIYLRGVGSSAISNGFDQSVSLNIDGVSMSRGREIISAQYDVQQVEVLKGPQALFFGKNSTAGVVNIVSRDPGQNFEASAKVGYDFNAQQVYSEGVISGPLSDSFRARLAVRAEHMNGWAKNMARANNASGFMRQPDRDRAPYVDSLSGRITLVYEPAGSAFDAKLKASYSYYKDSDSGPPERLCGAGRTAPLPTFGIAEPYEDCKIDGRYSRATMPIEIARTFLYGRDGKQYLENKSHYVSLTMNYRLPTILLTSVTSHYGYDITHLTTLNGSTAVIANSIATTWNQTAQEIRAASQFDGPFNFTAGGFYGHGRQTMGNGVMVSPPALDPATGKYGTFDRQSAFTGDSLSVFAELSYDILPQLTLAGGARWSHEKKVSFARNIWTNPIYIAAYPVKQLNDRFTDNNVSPQATLTWKPTSDIMVYGAYKEGFKAGGFNTYATITATATAADARFKSELVKGFEAGIRTTWLNRRITANITAFNYNFTNLQVAVLNPVLNLAVTANAGSLRTKGVEAEFTWQDFGVRGLSLRSQIAYTDARYGTYVGQCYTGQRPVQGCNLIPAASGAFTAQSYSGRTAPKAPKWAIQGGMAYLTDVATDYKAGFTLDVQYSSKYNFTDTLRPDGFQNAYAKVDASLSLSGPDDRWKLALIGRNLTNKWIITAGNDLIGNTGAGGTGLATGVRPDIGPLVDRGRQFYVELTANF